MGRAVTEFPHRYAVPTDCVIVTHGSFEKWALNNIALNSIILKLFTYLLKFKRTYVKNIIILYRCLKENINLIFLLVIIIHVYYHVPRRKILFKFIKYYWKEFIAQASSLRSFRFSSLSSVELTP